MVTWDPVAFHPWAGVLFCTLTTQDLAAAGIACAGPLSATAPIDPAPRATTPRTAARTLPDFAIPRSRMDMSASCSGNCEGIPSHACKSSHVHHRYVTGSTLPACAPVQRRRAHGVCHGGVAD